MTRARDLADSADKDISGTLTLDDIVLSNDLTVADNGKIILGASSDLQLFHDAANSFSAISDQGTGPLVLLTNQLLVQNSGGTANLLKATEGGAVELLHSNAVKIATSSSGVDVTGTVTSSGVVNVGTASGTQPSYFNSFLNVQNNGSTGSHASVTITSGSGGYAGLHFGDSDNGRIGQVSYNNSDNSLLFTANNSERVRISADGTVGIGNTISSSFYNGGNNLVVGSGSGSEGITIYGGAESNLFFADGTSIEANLVGRIEYSHGSEKMLFYINNAFAMSIVSDGAVGIGTNSPSGIHSLAKVLEISGGDGGDLIIGNNASSNIGAGAHVGAIAFKNIDSSTGSVPHYAGIRCEAADTSGNMDLRFYTGISNLEADTPQAMIDQNGNLLVGATAAFTDGSVNTAATNGICVATNSGNAGCLNLKLTGGNGTISRFIRGGQANGGVVGSISITTSSTAYNTSSDYRLKENVVGLTGATTRLKQLEPKRFNFIADADTTVDGFLAHEVQSVVPEAITGTHNEVDDDGNPVYQGIDQSKLVPLLVATIKELEARITALEGA